MVFVFCLSNLLAEAGWAAESRVGIHAFFSFPLSLITLRVIVVMSFPDSSPDVGQTLHSHREGSSKRCKERLSLLLLHHTRGAQGSFEKPDRTSVSKWATNPSSSLSVAFVGCKIVIAASSVALKASFHLCPVSEGMLLPRRQIEAAKAATALAPDSYL